MQKGVSYRPKKRGDDPMSEMICALKKNGSSGGTVKPIRIKCVAAQNPFMTTNGFADTGYTKVKLIEKSGVSAVYLRPDVYNPSPSTTMSVGVEYTFYTSNANSGIIAQGSGTMVLEFY